MFNHRKERHSVITARLSIFITFLYNTLSEISLYENKFPLVRNTPKMRKF